MNNYCEIRYIDGEIEKAGWRVYQASWQSHRNGKPIKTPLNQRRPRWKLRGVFETKELAEQFCIENGLKFNKTVCQYLRDSVE